MKNKLKITYYMILVIVFFSSIALFSNVSTIRGHEQSIESLVVTQKDEIREMSRFKAMEVAKSIASSYRNGLSSTTMHYLEKYKYLCDEERLTKLFNRCNSILEIPLIYGWNEARVVPLSYGEEDFQYIIGKSEDYSFTEEERIIIDKIRNGDYIALESGPETHLVGVSLLDYSKTYGKVVAGCIQCHERILKDRTNDNLNLEFDHIRGAILFEIPRESKKPNIN